MTEIYSGRFDLLDGDFEDTTKELNRSLSLFQQFIDEYAKCDKYVVTFEKFEKDGFTPTKAHYHFIMYTDKKHDTLRAKLSSLGWKGSLASLSNAVAPPKRTLEKSFHYVLKHQNIVLGKNIDNMEELLESAKKYNAEIVLKPNFEMHFMNFIIPEFVKRNIVYRGDMLIYIIEYVAKYNNNERGVVLDIPAHSVMLRFIQRYETKHLPKMAPRIILNDFRWIEGFNESANDNIVKEQFIQKQELEKLSLSKIPDYFENSDSENDLEI